MAADAALRNWHGSDLVSANRAQAQVAECAANQAAGRVEQGQERV